MWPTSDNQRQWVLQTLIKDVIAIVQQVRPWNPVSFYMTTLGEHSESPYAIVGFLWLSFTSLIVTKRRKNNSILLHSGLDADWQFWLSARFSLDYKWNQLRMFSTICKNNFWNFWDVKTSRKMFKIVNDSKSSQLFFIFRQLKNKLKNRFVCWNQSTMQHDALLHFGWLFIEIRF